MKNYQKILLFIILVFLFISQQILFHIDYYNKKVDLKLRQIYKIFIPHYEKQMIPNIVNEKLLKILQEGNNTIYMLHTYNHPPTGENWEPSHDLLSLYGDNLNEQSIIENTCLREKGKVEASNINKIFSLHKIPIGDVFTSPLCRNKETALLAFDKITSEYNFMLYPEIMNPSDIMKNKTWLKELFIKKPENGNKILIGHGGIITEVLGFPDDINQSGMFIYNHDLGKPILKLDYIDIVKMYHLKN